jgi:hypothetical protein
MVLLRPHIYVQDCERQANSLINKNQHNFGTYSTLSHCRWIYKSTLNHPFKMTTWVFKLLYHNKQLTIRQIHWLPLWKQLFIYLSKIAFLLRSLQTLSVWIMLATQYNVPRHSHQLYKVVNSPLEGMVMVASIRVLVTMPTVNGFWQAAKQLCKYTLSHLLCRKIQVCILLVNEKPRKCDLFHFRPVTSFRHS